MSPDAHGLHALVLRCARGPHRCRTDDPGHGRGRERRARRQRPLL